MKSRRFSIPGRGPLSRIWISCFCLVASLLAPSRLYAQQDSADFGRLLNLAEKKIHAALSEPTRVEFIDTPLGDVIDFLEDMHNIEIELDGDGVDTDLPITKNLAKLSLASALDLMLYEHDLTHVIHDEVLLISPPVALNTRETTEVY